MHRNVPLALVLAVLILAVPARARALPGSAYVGGGIGASFIDTQVSDLNAGDFQLDGNEFAYKFFAGYRIRFVALEGGWRDFGKVQGEGSAAGAYAHPTSWDVFAVLNLAIAMVDVFGKAGVSFTDVETAIEDVDSTDFAWGLGAGLFFGSLGVRAEYENFTAEGSDTLAMISASGVLRF